VATPFLKVIARACPLPRGVSAEFGTVITWPAVPISRLTLARAPEASAGSASGTRTTTGYTGPTTGARTGSSIADGLPTDFGFTVVAHPSRGDTLWLIPVTADSERVPPGGQLQVQRSSDAGASWVTCSAGLPAPSYTCVLRDAAAADTNEPAGIYFGTRNGEVYASGDEGESFARIAEQLPDVLCVRAAVLT